MSILSHDSPVAGAAASLDDETRAYIDHWLAKFPAGKAGRRGAVIQALFKAQQNNGGWLSTELMDAVADYLDLPPVWVYEVASFYSMLETRPVGRNTVAICTNISCMLRGANRIVDHVESRLGVKLGETTSDGRIYLKKEEECVAACVGAPMMIVNGHYHERLTEQTVDEILDGLE